MVGLFVASALHSAQKASCDRISVVVTDTSPGIPDKDLPLVFDGFYRVDRARATAAGGVV